MGKCFPRKTTHTHTQKYLGIPCRSGCRRLTPHWLLAALPFQTWLWPCPPWPAPASSGLRSPGTRGHSLPGMEPLALTSHRKAGSLIKVKKEKGRILRLQACSLHSTKGNLVKPDSSWEQGPTLWISPGASSLGKDKIAQAPWAPSSSQTSGSLTNVGVPVGPGFSQPCCI